MIKRIITEVRFFWHRKVLKDDWLYPDDDNLPLDDIDPWTGEPFDFTVTNDMIWNPSTKELEERFLPSGEPMPDVPWLKFEDEDEEVME